MMQNYNNYSPRNRVFCTKLQINLKIFCKVLYFNVVENLDLYVGNGIKRDFGVVGKGITVSVKTNRRSVACVSPDMSQHSVPTV